RVDRRAQPIEVRPQKSQETIPLSAVKPDDGGQVRELFWGEVVDLTRHLPEDLARVDHENLVAALLGLALVEVPELAGHRARVEEVRADRDHDVDVAGLDDLAPDLSLGMARARRLRRHDKPGAAL